MKEADKELQKLKEEKHTLENDKKQADKKFEETKKELVVKDNLLKREEHEVKVLEDLQKSFDQEVKKLEDLMESKKVGMLPLLTGGINLNSVNIEHELEVIKKKFKSRKLNFSILFYLLQGLNDEIDTIENQIKEKQIDIVKEEKSLKDEQQKASNLESLLAEAKQKRASLSANKSAGSAANDSQLLTGGIGGAIGLANVDQLDKLIKKYEEELENAKRNMTQFLKSYESKKTEKENLGKDKEAKKIEEKTKSQVWAANLSRANADIAKLITELRQKNEAISQEINLKKGHIESERQNLLRLQDSFNSSQDSKSQSLHEFDQNNQKIVDQLGLFVNLLGDKNKKELKEALNKDGKDSKLNDAQTKVSNLKSEKQASASQSAEADAKLQKSKASKDKSSNSKSQMETVDRKRSSLDSQMKAAQTQLSVIDNKLGHVKKYQFESFLSKLSFKPQFKNTNL